MNEHRPQKRRRKHRPQNRRREKVGVFRLTGQYLAYISSALILSGKDVKIRHTNWEKEICDIKRRWIEEVAVRVLYFDVVFASITSILGLFFQTFPPAPLTSAATRWSSARWPPRAPTAPSWASAAPSSPVGWPASSTGWWPYRRMCSRAGCRLVRLTCPPFFLSY